MTLSPPTEPMVDRPAEAFSVEETGLPPTLVLDLVLKHAFVEGTVTLKRLTERTKLSTPIIHSLYRHLQKEHLCETRTMVGDDYEISLSAKGRGMAEVALKKSQYAGPAPVPLKEYNRLVSKQGIGFHVTADSLRATLGDLVVPDHVIHELGAALVTGGSILLYGTTGNGKTSLAERVHRSFDDLVYVPYAVEASGEILGVFDPLIHRSHDRHNLAGDPRWVLCSRPMVKVGGEMRSEMLEPRVDEVTRVCIGPLQMKANNGVLLIDDFGRQRITPRELLNRWIVPLDRRTDVLNLWSGVSFEMPFEVLVVFATNLALSSLAEDAFLRRLKNKIKIEPLSDDLFRELLRRVFREKDLECTPDMGEYIRAECLERSPDGLRACYPADLATSICGIAAFEQRAPTLDKDHVDRALNLYFAH
jgi:predicted ATPase with chaperone activity